VGGGWNGGWGGNVEGMGGGRLVWVRAGEGGGSVNFTRKGGGGSARGRAHVGKGRMRGVCVPGGEGEGNMQQSPG